MKSEFLWKPTFRSWWNLRYSDLDEQVPSALCMVYLQYLLSWLIPYMEGVFVGYILDLHPHPGCQLTRRSLKHVLGSESCTKPWLATLKGGKGGYIRSDTLLQIALSSYPKDSDILNQDVDPKLVFENYQRVHKKQPPCFSYLLILQ